MDYKQALIEAKVILEKHCPSMNSLYLDKQGVEFRDRVIKAMEEYANQRYQVREKKK